VTHWDRRRDNTAGINDDYCCTSGLACFT